MNNNALETFIQHCGSVKQAVKVLGLDREHVSAMRRGIIEIHLIYALEIQKHMQDKAGKQIHLFDLVPRQT